MSASSRPAACARWMLAVIFLGIHLSAPPPAKSTEVLPSRSRAGRDGATIAGRDACATSKSGAGRSLPWKGARVCRQASDRGCPEPAKLGGFSSGQILLANFTEETLPAEEMPATPAATVSPIPGASAEAPYAAPPPAPPTPAAAVSATQGLPPLTGGGTTATGATGTGAPPPIDLGSTTTPPISDAPLTRLVDNAGSPARAASLRLTEQARLEITGGHASEAIRSLTRALSIDSSNPYAYFYLGRAYFHRKDYRQALTFLQRAEIGFGPVAPWLGETLSFEGACYEQSGQTGDAVAAYKRALDSSPYNLMARAGYARLAPVQPDSGVAPSPGVEAPPSFEAPPPASPPPEPVPPQPPPPGPGA